MIHEIFFNNNLIKYTHDITKYSTVKNENFKIFEKASDIRKSDTAIQLGFNCFQALKDLGVLELVKNRSILMNSLNIYSKNNFLKKTNIKYLMIKNNIFDFNISIKLNG